MARRRPHTQAQGGIKYGFRSGLEGKVGAQLSGAGIEFEYEPFKTPFIEPAKKRTYTIDFYLPNGILVETKGRFLSADRQKHKWLREQYPDLDLRFLFSNANTKIGKKSKTTYAMWAESHGFKWAHGRIPEEWLHEPVNELSLAVIEEITNGTAEERIAETIRRLNQMYKDSL